MNNKFVDETWKDIDKFDGHYQVSNCGRVRSVDRIGTYRNYKGKIVNVPYKGKIMTPSDSRGYEATVLDGKSVRIHRLVAEAFVPNPDNLPVVNHIDGNKKNNMAKNLEWVTQKRNMEHARENGLLPDKKSSLSRYDIHRARYIYVPGKNSKTSSCKLAKKYGVSESHMYRILSGEKCKLKDFDTSSIVGNACQCPMCGHKLFEINKDTYIEHLPMKCDECGFDFEVNTPVLHRAPALK